MHQIGGSLLRNCLSPLALQSLYFDLFFGSSVGQNSSLRKEAMIFSRRFSVSISVVISWFLPWISLCDLS